MGCLLKHVQIGLVVLWLLAVALLRICDNVQGACAHLWVFLQQLSDRQRADFEVRASLGSFGDSIRVSAAEIGPDSSTEELWRHLVEFTEEWWDNRTTRRNPKALDFKHKTTRMALWINNYQTPEWARIRFQL